ncbi:MAG: hypothetical protein ABI878_12860 [Acidobacteriota bacterium]
MGYSDEASDWQACGVAQAGAVVGVGAGIFVYEFRSKSADIRAKLFFAAVGVGAGVVSVAV